MQATRLGHCEYDWQCPTCACWALSPGSAPARQLSRTAPPPSAAGTHTVSRFLSAYVQTYRTAPSCEPGAGPV